MKNLITFILLAIPLISFGQDSEYQVRSYQEQGNLAPNTHYLGEAWLNRLLTADENLTYNVTKATFKANSTLDWHKHSSAQVLIYVDGQGYYQERGKAPIVLKAGDVIKCNPGVEHWHSSTKDSDVTYLAIYGGDAPTVWTEVVTQAYYDEVAEKL